MSFQFIIESETAGVEKIQLTGESSQLFVKEGERERSLILPLFSFSSSVLERNPCRMVMAVSEISMSSLICPAHKEKGWSSPGIEMGDQLFCPLAIMSHLLQHMCDSYSTLRGEDKCSTCLRKVKFKKSHFCFLICSVCGRGSEQKP